MFANAAGARASASIENKLRTQRAPFANGPTVSKDGFGAPEPISVFKKLEGNTEDESSLASPRGFEPLLPP